MVIGLIEPIGGHGGMDYYDYGLSLGLSKSGVVVEFHTSDSTNPRFYPNVTTRFSFKNLWKSSIFLKGVIFLLGHFKAYFDVAKKGGTIIHLHYFTFRSIDCLNLLLAKLFRFRVIVTIHDVSSFSAKANFVIEKICILLIDGIIVHNETSLKLFKDKHQYHKPIKIIPHGNYLPFFQVSFTKKIDSSVITILFFGQIKEVKGLDILLRSIAILKEKKYRIRLIIAGKVWKTDINLYKTMIHELAISDIVETHFRYIPDFELTDFFSRADFVVLPYREIFQSGVLLLSLSLNKPVICSDLDAFKEVIKHNYTGFLFQNGSPESLATVIIDIIHNLSILSFVSLNTQLLIKSKFSWIDIGRQTQEFYKYVDISKEY